MEDDDRSQLLVIVFDVNPIWWGLRALQGQAQITKCLDCLLVFINSYLMLHHDNKIAVIASHTSKSKFLYPRRDQNEQNAEAKKEESRYQKFAVVNDTIIDSFKELMSSEMRQDEIRSDSLIAGSLTLAMCYIHRVEREAHLGKKKLSRILVVKSADDTSSQYMSFMNVIFAAQKQHVVIDSCVLGTDSGLLQQACDMTGGIYMKIPTQDSLLQYLLTSYLIDSDLRKNLSLSSTNQRKSGVDFRAACFCHRNLVDVGFVCSVCLSIFCQFSPICTTCETAFRPPQSLSIKSRKKRKATQATG